VGTVSADRLIRGATAAVVTAVAAFAAVVSYSHVYDLGRLHGQSGTAARMLPLSVDGLILAASLVLLHEARNGRSAPPLARWMLWLGVAATLTANALYGITWGVLGVALSAWPGAAFVGSVELLMGMVRRTRAVPAEEPAPQTVPAPQPEPAAQGDRVTAARDALRRTTEAGNALSGRQLSTRFELTRSELAQVRSTVLAEANGHSGDHGEVNGCGRYGAASCPITTKPYGLPVAPTHSWAW
jgi:hypothetical protein